MLRYVFLGFDRTTFVYNASQGLDKPASKPEITADDHMEDPSPTPET